MLKKIKESLAKLLKNLKKSIPTHLSCEAVSDFKKVVSEMDKDFLDTLSSVFLFLTSLLICGILVFVYGILGGLI